MWWRKRKPDPPALSVQVLDIDARVSALDSRLRQMELEQQGLHDQVHRWMRRAIAAERAAGRQEPDTDGVQEVTPAAPEPQWGARARIAQRKGLSDGLHP